MHVIIQMHTIGHALSTSFVDGRRLGILLVMLLINLNHNSPKSSGTPSEISLWSAKDLNDS